MCDDRSGTMTPPAISGVSCAPQQDDIGLSSSFLRGRLADRAAAARAAVEERAAAGGAPGMAAGGATMGGGGHAGRLARRQPNPRFDGGDAVAPVAPSLVAEGVGLRNGGAGEDQECGNLEEEDAYFLAHYGDEDCVVLKGDPDVLAAGEGRGGGRYDGAGCCITPSDVGGSVMWINVDGKACDEYGGQATPPPPD